VENEQVVATGICADEFGEPLVEETNIGLQLHQPALAKTPQHGVLKMSRLVHRCGMLITELAPHGCDFGEAFKGLIASHNPRRHSGLP
jgi:hypothetical protein